MLQFYSNQGTHKYICADPGCVRKYRFLETMRHTTKFSFLDTGE